MTTKASRKTDRMYQDEYDDDDNDDECSVNILSDLLFDFDGFMKDLSTEFPSSPTNPLDYNNNDNDDDDDDGFTKEEYKLKYHSKLLRREIDSVKDLKKLKTRYNAAGGTPQKEDRCNNSNINNNDNILDTPETLAIKAKWMSRKSRRKGKTKSLGAIRRQGLSQC